MKIAFYDYSDFDLDKLRLIEDIARERGHTIGGPADIVFMMAFTKNIERIRIAAGFGVGDKPIIMLRYHRPDWEDARDFLKTGKVLDIVPIPYSGDQARELFAAIEAGKTSTLR